MQSGDLRLSVYGKNHFCVFRVNSDSIKSCSSITTTTVLYMLGSASFKGHVRACSDTSFTPGNTDELQSMSTHFFAREPAFTFVNIALQ